MRAQLSPIDAGAQDLGLCRGFVYALPGADGPAGDRLVAALERATRTVVEQWSLLQGRPIWQETTRTWVIDIPDSPEKAGTAAFTTARATGPYHRSVGADRPLEPISPSSASGAVRPFIAAHFRHADTPSTMKQLAKSGHPLLSVHVVRFDDAVSLGVSAPHGVFDGTGLAHVLAGISAALYGTPWEAPPTNEVNPVSEARLHLILSESTSSEVHGSEQPPKVFLGWTPFSVLSLLSLLLQTVWEAWWHKDKMRYALISREAVDRLVAKVKEEVKVETAGREWVSTGDILTAWTLKSLHAGETSAQGRVSCSPVFNTRSLLAIASPELAASLAAHTGNAVSPYSLSSEPIPISHLASMSTGALALLHRRTLARCKTVPWLRELMVVGDRITQGGRKPMLPERDFPWTVDGPHGTTRWIVSNHMSAFAHLRIPRSAALGIPAGPNDVTGEEGAELPLLAYYRHVEAPLHLNAAFALQLSEMGVFVVVSARRTRWNRLLQAIKALDQES